MKAPGADVHHHREVVNGATVAPWPPLPADSGEMRVLGWSRSHLPREVAGRGSRRGSDRIDQGVTANKAGRLLPSWEESNHLFQKLNLTKARKEESGIPHIRVNGLI